MTFLNWRARCVLGLLSALSVTSKEDLCIVRMSEGKIQRFGNCQEIDKSSILEDLRLKAQEASTTPTSTPQMTNAVITEDSTVIQTTKQAEARPGLVYDGCKTSTSGGCFWTAIIAPSYTNFTRANKTCASYGSVLAVIPDRKTYDEITMNMRKKLTTERYVISCWLGMTYNVTTGEIHPPGAYNNEKLSVELRSYNPSDTNLLVNIKLKRNPNREGLFNRNKSMKYGGAVCWKPKI